MYNFTIIPFCQSFKYYTTINLTIIYFLLRTDKIWYKLYQFGKSYIRNSEIWYKLKQYGIK